MQKNNKLDIISILYNLRLINKKNTSILKYYYCFKLKVVPKNIIPTILLRITRYYILVYNILIIVISNKFARSIFVFIIYFDSINLEV
jgi:hypothetical protein